ncbi:MAG: MFS transporter [Chitinophagaceae bacterium]|nr:MFS transporter [Chitinophagaceae bacterium]
MEKPILKISSIWNMSLGFLGIQFGFALQNVNGSRILQTFGADAEHLSYFWLAAPITGLIVQPLVGHFSDKTWNRLGRRRPYFLGGAILSSAALILLPNSSGLVAFLPPLLVGAGLLMLMDASFNISMEPFRALVADMLPDKQRTHGFAIQTCLIGIGAVLGSSLPYILAEMFSISKTAESGLVPDNVLFSFYVGAFIFMGTIIWTVYSTKEYPPHIYREFDSKTEPATSRGIIQIFIDLAHIPKTMKQIGVVQFFSWCALFLMWVYMTPVIAQHVYGLPADDRSSAIYNEAANWVGIMFGTYNAISALVALFIPFIAKKIGKKGTHSLSLFIGGIGILSLFFIKNPNLLLASMFCVGFAWASILSMPYSLLAGAIPHHKMGIFMGIFNFFIVVPQIVIGLMGGWILSLVHNQVIYLLILSGVCFLIASCSVFFIQEKKEI